MARPGHGPSVPPEVSVPVMSQRLLKALGGITSIVVVATALQVSPAQAREHEPESKATPSLIVVQAKATGPDHFDSSVSVDVPINGKAQITSPTLDPSIKKAKIELTAPLSDQPGFERMATTLVQQPSRVGRFVTCLILVQDALSDELTDAASDSSDLRDYEADAPSLLLVRLVMCLRISELIAQIQAGQRGTSGRLASPSCGQGLVGLKEKVSNSGGTYHLAVKGAPNNKRKNAKVKVKCKVVSPTKTVMTVRAKKKGQSLRSVLGSNVALGLASPSDASQGAKVTVAFSAP